MFQEFEKIVIEGFEFTYKKPNLQQTVLVIDLLTKGLSNVLYSPSQLVKIPPSEVSVKCLEAFQDPKLNGEKLLAQALGSRETIESMQRCIKECFQIEHPYLLKDEIFFALVTQIIQDVIS